MYSEQLEQLIQSVIADGVITEKERTVLHKKAAAEGVDEDEIDVYVDGLLAKVEPKVKAPKKYNLSVLDKLLDRHNDYGYYQFKKFYRVISALPAPIELFIVFADIVEDNREKGKLVGKKALIIGGYLNKKKYIRHYDSTLIIKTNIGSIKSEAYYPVSRPLYKGKEFEFYHTYIIDADQLKMLADSKSFKLSLGSYYTYDNYIAEKGYINKEDFELKNINCPGLQSYAQCFYREVVDGNAYQDAEITNAPPVESSNTDDLPEDIDADVAAGLLSTKPKKLAKTDVNLPLLKQYVGVDGIVVTHISDKKKIGPTLYPFLRLHALTHPKAGTKFYLGYTTESNFSELSRLRIRVNMRDFVLDGVAEDERFLDKYYRDRGYVHFNFFEIDNELLKQILTTQTGIAFYEGGDTGKEFKINKLPKKWLKAYTLITDSKAFEQWKQEQANFKKEHPVLNFCRSHKVLTFIAIIFIVLALLLFVLILIEGI